MGLKIKVISSEYAKNKAKTYSQYPSPPPYKLSSLYTLPFLRQSGSAFPYCKQPLKYSGKRKPAPRGHSDTAVVAPDFLLFMIHFLKKTSRKRTQEEEDFFYSLESSSVLVEISPIPFSTCPVTQYHFISQGITPWVGQKVSWHFYSNFFLISILNNVTGNNSYHLVRPLCFCMAQF